MSNKTKPKVKRGSVTLPIELLHRVDKVVDSRLGKKLGYSSRADAVSDVLTDWLPGMEAKVDEIEDWFLKEKEKLVASD